MKVFSKKKFFEITSNCEIYCKNDNVRKWVDAADGKPVVGGMWNGWVIPDPWTEEVYNPVEDAAKKEREDLWATLNSYDWKSFFETEKKPAPEAINCRCTVLKEAPPKHPRYKIVIECNDDFTTAKMYVDGQQVKGECAKRNPADKFSWRIGAQTAFNRLWEKKKKPAVREVRRRAKPGEWVKIVEATNDMVNDYKNGEVLLIVPYNGVSCKELAHYKDEETKFLYDKEYVVLEGYKPE